MRRIGGKDTTNYSKNRTKDLETTIELLDSNCQFAKY